MAPKSRAESLVVTGAIVFGAAMVAALAGFGGRPPRNPNPIELGLQLVSLPGLGLGLLLFRPPGQIEWGIVAVGNTVMFGLLAASLRARGIVRWLGIIGTVIAMALLGALGVFAGMFRAIGG